MYKTYKKIVQIIQLTPNKKPSTLCVEGKESKSMKTYENYSNSFRNKFHHKTLNDEILSLHKTTGIGYIRLVVAKSTAERGNSNNLRMANNSTPFNNRAFFVLGLNTPKENNRLKFELVTFLSMMAFSGQRLTVGCVPYVAVFHPAKRYRLAVESKAIDFNKSHMELSAMIYKFLTTSTGTKRLRISITANSLADALSKCQFTQRPLLIARYAKKPLNLTACTAKGGVYVA